MSDKRLKAFCEGLEMQDIPKLMTGTVEDFRRVGQVMADRIKSLAEREAAFRAKIELLREAHKKILGWRETDLPDARAIEYMESVSREALAATEGEK